MVFGWKAVFRHRGWVGGSAPGRGGGGGGRTSQIVYINVDFFVLFCFVLALRECVRRRRQEPAAACYAPLPPAPETSQQQYLVVSFGDGLDCPVSAHKNGTVRMWRDTWACVCCRDAGEEGFGSAHAMLLRSEGRT